MWLFAGTFSALAVIYEKARWHRFLISKGVDPNHPDFRHQSMGDKIEKYVDFCRAHDDNIQFSNQIVRFLFTIFNAVAACMDPAENPFFEFVTGSSFVSRRRRYQAGRRKMRRATRGGTVARYTSEIQLASAKIRETQANIAVLKAKCAKYNQKLTALTLDMVENENDNDIAIDHYTGKHDSMLAAVKDAELVLYARKLEHTRLLSSFAKVSSNKDYSLAHYYAAQEKEIPREYYELREIATKSRKLYRVYLRHFEEQSMTNDEEFRYPGVYDLEFISTMMRETRADFEEAEAKMNNILRSVLGSHYQAGIRKRLIKEGKDTSTLDSTIALEESMRCRAHASRDELKGNLPVTYANMTPGGIAEMHERINEINRNVSMKVIEKQHVQAGMRKRLVEQGRDVTEHDAQVAHNTLIHAQYLRVNDQDKAAHATRPGPADPVLYGREYVYTMATIRGDRRRAEFATYLRHQAGEGDIEEEGKLEEVILKPQLPPSLQQYKNWYLASNPIYELTAANFASSELAGCLDYYIEARKEYVAEINHEDQIIYNSQAEDLNKYLLQHPYVPPNDDDAAARNPKPSIIDETLDIDDFGSWYYASVPLYTQALSLLSLNPGLYSIDRVKALRKASATRSLKEADRRKYDSDCVSFIQYLAQHRNTVYGKDIPNREFKTCGSSGYYVDADGKFDPAPTFAEAFIDYNNMSNQMAKNVKEAVNSVNHIDDAVLLRKLKSNVGPSLAVYESHKLAVRDYFVRNAPLCINVVGFGPWFDAAYDVVVHKRGVKWLEYCAVNSMSETLPVFWADDKAYYWKQALVVTNVQSKRDIITRNKPDLNKGVELTHVIPEAHLGDLRWLKSFSQDVNLGLKFVYTTIDSKKNLEKKKTRISKIKLYPALPQSDEPFNENFTKYHSQLEKHFAPKNNAENVIHKTYKTLINQISSAWLDNRWVRYITYAVVVLVAGVMLYAAINPKGFSLQAKAGRRNNRHNVAPKHSAEQYRKAYYETEDKSESLWQRLQAAIMKGNADPEAIKQWRREYESLGRMLERLAEGEERAINYEKRARADEFDRVPTNSLGTVKGAKGKGGKHTYQSSATKINFNNGVVNGVLRLYAHDDHKIHAIYTHDADKKPILISNAHFFTKDIINHPVELIGYRVQSNDGKNKITKLKMEYDLSKCPFIKHDDWIMFKLPSDLNKFKLCRVPFDITVPSFVGFWDTSSTEFMKVEATAERKTISMPFVSRDGFCGTPYYALNTMNANPSTIVGMHYAIDTGNKGGPAQALRVTPELVQKFNLRTPTLSKN